MRYQAKQREGTVNDVINGRNTTQQHSKKRLSETSSYLFRLECSAVAQAHLLSCLILQTAAGVVPKHANLGPASDKRAVFEPNCGDAVLGAIAAAVKGGIAFELHHILFICGMLSQNKHSELEEKEQMMKTHT